jgi:hypothetical protein
MLHDSLWFFDAAARRLVFADSTGAATSVDLTRFGGHLNRSDYGSEHEVFHGQETTGV